MKVQASSLAKECVIHKMDLLTNATVVEDAMKFVEQSKGRLKMCSSEINNKLIMIRNWNKSRKKNQENKQVSEYLGTKWNMEHNRKIKPVVDMLLNNHGKNIKLMNMNPIVLQYIEDDNSVSDISHAQRNIMKRISLCSSNKPEDIATVACI
jgi:hypothetical protein